MEIKFGTDGWRAIIAKEFTVENLARVAQGTANWLLQSHPAPTVVIGHDCRFAGELFAETVAKVMAVNNIKVFMANGFVSTPMISMGVLQYQSNVGIVITASHNPPEYNGYKLKGSYGGPLMDEEIHQVEELIPDTIHLNLDSISLTDLDYRWQGRNH
jgi:phosphomannomutase